MSRFIYFIENGRYVKIGVTSDVRKRFLQISWGLPTESKLIGYISGGEEEERLLHKELASFRVRGEWFLLPKSVKKHLAKISKKMVIRNERLFLQEKTLMKENARRVINGWPPRRSGHGYDLIENNKEKRAYINMLIQKGYIAEVKTA